MAPLETLSQRSETLAAEGHDVRGWAVRTRVDDQEAGRVHDLLVDERGRSRFLDIEVDDDRHVLLPVGEAMLDPASEVVHVPGLDRAALGGLPEYHHDRTELTDDYTRSVITAHDDAYRDEDFYMRSHYGAGWSPGRDTDGRGRLDRLDDLDDVKVADHSADPRGWEVVDRQGERVGEVDHLIGDTGIMKVRYLTVELEDEVAGSGRKVLIPAGHVDLNTERKRVVARALDRHRFKELPPYDGRRIDREYETRLTRRYNDVYSGGHEYQHPRYRTRMLNSSPVV